MDSLSKTITNELREILEGCQSGKLQHYQQNFHCGTKHCIAGWWFLFDYAKLKNDDSVFTAHLSSVDAGELVRDISEEFYTLDYIVKTKGLTTLEASLLFEAHSAFDLQFAVLEALEAGQRLEDDAFFVSVPDKVFRKEEITPSTAEFLVKNGFKPCDENAYRYLQF